MNTTDGEAEVFKDSSHPLGVTAGEVVVNGDDVYAHSSEAVKEDWECCDEGFSFTGLHFCNHSTVESNSSDELDVKVNHFPGDGLVADLDRLAAEAARCVFDRGKCLRHDLVEILGTHSIEMVFSDFPELCFGFLDRVNVGLYLGE